MPKFVIQKHRSNTLHYDFRLEIGNVLKSWAVPKGLSLNPKEKRLAVETDDHAISYMHFEGTIPENSYGAGEVIIWDKGEYSFEDNSPIADQYEKGTIKVILDGERIKGGFNIIRMEWDDKPIKWLIIKEYDDYISYDEKLKEFKGSIVSLRRLD